jgi:cytochrome c biogenesis protein CcmG, thiol:disulfide interchange protein DsbE
MNAHTNALRGGRILNMMRLCACAALLLAVCPATAAKGVKTSPANAKSLSLLGKPAPEFRLPDLDERAFDLAVTSGHIVLVSFWASWCPPCRAEMATLARLQKEMATEMVDVVLVAMDTPAKAQRFLKKAHLDARTLVDENKKLANVYGVRTIPRAFLIDRDGMVRRVLFGGSSEKDLRKAIAAARE